MIIKNRIRQAILMIVIIFIFVGCNNASDDPIEITAPTSTDTSSTWIPSVSTSWQWQLTTPVDQTVDAEVYDIDVFDNDAGIVEALHSKGRKVIGYINTGAWEDWRDDASQFPSSVLGNNYEGWAGEKWLDIRQIDLLAPIIRARLDQCKAKGFDAVEPDNIDGYTNNTGFPLTYQDQLAYNIWLANEAHIRGLSIGLKNDPDQVADLLQYFDWAMTEDCFADGWYSQMKPFTDAGKTVYSAEYTDRWSSVDQFRSTANSTKFITILKHRDLDAYRQTCQ